MPETRTPFDETADNLSAMVLAITTHQTIESEKDTAAPEHVEVALLLYSILRFLLRRNVDLASEDRAN